MQHDGHVPRPASISAVWPTAGARILFLVRVPQARHSEFLEAYQQVRYAVADGVPGHLRDQVCQSATDPEQWLITSEWVDLDAFDAWERSEGHRTLVRPLRDCMTEARSLRFRVRAETRRGHTGASSTVPAPRGGIDGS
jgi:heme oxygenase (mycobilin-producing)